MGTNTQLFAPERKKQDLKAFLVLGLLDGGVTLNLHLGQNSGQSFL